MTRVDGQVGSSRAEHRRDGGTGPIQLNFNSISIQFNVHICDQVKDMINVIDANGDGSIDWNEFQMVFGGAPTFKHIGLTLIRVYSNGTPRSAQSLKLVWLQVTTW